MPNLNFMPSTHCKHMFHICSTGEIVCFGALYAFMGEREEDEDVEEQDEGEP